MSILKKVINHIETLILVLTVIAGSIWGFIANDDAERILVIEFVLITVTVALLVSFIKDRVLGPSQLQRELIAISQVFELQRQGINTVSAGPNRLDYYDTLLDSAKKSLLIVGTNMYNLVPDRLNTQINGILDKGVSVKLLLLNPSLDQSIYYSLGEAIVRPRIGEEISKAVIDIKKFKDSLSKKKTRLFSAFVYDFIPSYIGVVVDQDTEDLKIALELLPYKCGRDRPRIELSGGVRGSFQDSIIKGFKEMTKNAHEIS